ncbi:MAG: alpha-L-fucosidase [Planctomycetaceae bacterium]|nr:alpha-L-fucosidase [Planctomycetaceae bacterium]
MVADYTIENSSKAKLQATPEGVAAYLANPYILSVHWGLYALQGRGEWVYWNERIPLDVYRRRLSQFNPVRFNAEEWADLLVESGMRGLLITTKHHDGFCMWDTQMTDWNITRSVFKRDIIGELAQALHDRGLKLHFYYSLLDWTAPSYRNDWPAYVAYYQGHLRELLTHYGKIDGVIFDGYWPRAKFEGEWAEAFAARGKWDLAGTYDLIHSLQPQAMVCNNSHVPPQPGEDYQVWELDFPGENTTGFNTTDIGTLPKAVWWNLNSGWAYNPGIHNVKDPQTILQAMGKARSTNSVFYLNVGPRPWGDIHPQEQQTLREIGKYVREYRMLDNRAPAAAPQAAPTT